ncbi:MAG: aspartyl protease family protein [Thermoflexibacter sp.]
MSKKLLIPFLVLLFFVFILFLRKQNELYRLHQSMRQGKLTERQGMIDSIDFFFKKNYIILKLVDTCFSKAIFLSKPNSYYYFIFDTGSPTYFSKSLIAKLGLEQISNFTIQDDRGAKRNLPFYIANITLQNSDFQDIVVGEMSQNITLDSILISGIIGANLMQHSAWQIDYQQQKIYFANKVEAFSMPIENYPIPFIRNIFRIPCIYLMLNQFPRRPVALLSTGSPQAISLNYIFKSLHRSMKYLGGEVDTVLVNVAHQENILPPIYEFANTNDTLIVGKARELAINDLTANGVPTVFHSTLQNRLGNEFLKSYILTIDWQNRKLWLGKKKSEMSP